MSENIKTDSRMHKTNSATKLQHNKSYLYYMTMTLFISILSVTFSFVLLPFFSASAFMHAGWKANINMIINSYAYYNSYGLLWDLVMRVTRRFFYLPAWIAVIFRQLTITGFCVWGMIALKKKNKSVIAALYSLAAVFILYIGHFIYYSLRSLSTPKGMERALAYLKVCLTDYQNFTFMFFLTGAILCSFLLKYLLGEPVAEPAPAKKDSRGLGGWLVIAIIRTFGTALNYLMFVIFSVLTICRAEGLMKFGNGFAFSSFHLDFSLINVMILVLAILVLIYLFGKKYDFRYMAIILESVLLGYSLLYSLYLIMLIIRISGSSGGFGNYFAVLAIQMVSAAWSAVFIAYYVNSDRVKNTFIK